MLGGKIIRRKQCVVIFFAATDSLIILGFIECDAVIEGYLGGVARLSPVRSPSYGTLTRI